MYINIIIGFRFLKKAEEPTTLLLFIMQNFMKEEINTDNQRLIKELYRESESHKHNHIFTGQNRISDLFINAARRLEEYDYIINNIISVEMENICKMISIKNWKNHYGRYHYYTSNGTYEIDTIENSSNGRGSNTPSMEGTLTFYAGINKAYPHVIEKKRQHISYLANIAANDACYRFRVTLLKNFHSKYDKEKNIIHKLGAVKTLDDVTLMVAAHLNYMINKGEIMI